MTPSQPRIWDSAPGRLDAGRLLTGGAAALVCFLAVVPLVLLLYSSISDARPGELGVLTLDNYVRAYSARQTYELLANSLAYALGTAFLALALGSSLAWLCTRTNMPLKGAFFALSMAPMAVPGILKAMAWILLLSPRSGFINILLMQALGLPGAPFDVYSMWGMIWVQGLAMSPLVFIMMWAAFMSMDPSLEESATMSGGGIFSTFRRITLRLMLPAVLSIILISLVLGLESFEVPALVGLPNRIFVFSSAIYMAIRDMPVDYGLAGAYSVSLLGLSVVGVYLYNRATARQEQFGVVTGKGYRPRLIDLGPWRYVGAAFCVLYFLVVVGLPLLVLMWNSLIPYTAAPEMELLSKISLRNYQDVLSYGKIQQTFINTAIAATVTATTVVLLTAVISWIVVKTSMAGRGILDSLAFIPIALPGLPLAVGLIWVYVTLPLPVYGTIWILIIAYVTRFMPYGMRICSSTMVQIHKELEEASMVSGGSWLQTFRGVTLPLLRPALLTAWLYVALLSSRELASSILLYSPGSQVLSIMIWELWERGQMQQLASLGILMVFSLSVMVFFFHKLGGRGGEQV